MKICLEVKYISLSNIRDKDLRLEEFASTVETEFHKFTN